jgi:hypothetical protein
MENKMIARRDYFMSILSKKYNVKAQDAPGTYIIRDKTTGKKVASMACSYDELFIKFNN